MTEMCTLRRHKHHIIKSVNPINSTEQLKSAHTTLNYWWLILRITYMHAVMNVAKQSISFHKTIRSSWPTLRWLQIPLWQMVSTMHMIGEHWKDLSQEIINGKDGPGKEKPLCSFVNAVSILRIKTFFKNVSPRRLLLWEWKCEWKSKNENHRVNM